MLDLSPTKLVIIFVVAVVLLGPKRLPEVARQLGAGWRKLRALHQRVDQELRQSIPDLPSSQEIARFARSPISLLNQLAERQTGSSDPKAVVESTQASPPPGAAGRHAVVSHGVTVTDGLGADDPTLN